MTLMPESDSSSVETMSPMRSCPVRAGWRSFLTICPISRATTGRKTIEKMESFHEIMNIATR